MMNEALAVALNREIAETFSDPPVVFRADMTKVEAGRAFAALFVAIQQKRRGAEAATGSVWGGIFAPGQGVA